MIIVRTIFIYIDQVEVERQTSLTRVDQDKLDLHLKLLNRVENHRHQQQC